MPASPQSYRVGAPSGRRGKTCFPPSFAHSKVKTLRYSPVPNRFETVTEHLYLAPAPASSDRQGRLPNEPRMTTDWSTERRAKTRYPIELVVQYQNLQSSGRDASGRDESRIGVTVNFSSHGFLISAAQSQIPPQGSKLHVVVEWPVSLGGKTPLQFVVRGKVMRAELTTFALFFERYEFHIRKHRPAVR